MNWVYVLAAILIAISLRKLQIRLRLSKAKHPSLRGHSKMSRRFARLVPFFEYDEQRIFSCDGAPEEIVGQRREAFARLEEDLRARSPITIEATQALETEISDVRFTNYYRVPFPFRNFIRKRLQTGAIYQASEGTRLQDLDGNWSYDLFGSYGVNIFGYDFYKDCLAKGFERVKDLGPVLGPYHPIIADNVRRLKAVSGMDEVSFHMSGTEAVMQAVRNARYYTGKSHLVRFCGAYHGWWDGVQPGVGNRRNTRDVYTLKDIDRDTLKVLRTRKDIACVLVNPLQSLHPNSNAPGDSMLINSNRGAAFDYAGYKAWLEELRQVCTERNIVLIFDEVFVGFRLAYGGAQEYFGVKADLVTYGKSLGGGLPVGVVCGKSELMKRFREDRPADLCFARGTFNSHPYVLAAMNEFLIRIDTPEIREMYQSVEQKWNQRVEGLNQQLAERDLPIKIANLMSIWTVLYTTPSRYNWLFQHYLRREGLSLSWIGTGRFIFSHNYSDEDYRDVADRIISAAASMKYDGWWWQSPALTNKSIQKQFFREMVKTRLGMQL